MLRGIRTPVPFTFRSGLVALTALALMLGLATVTSRVAEAKAPTVYWGAKAGPRDVPAQKAATMAALPLPAGRYFVRAKAVLVGVGGSDGTHMGTDCLLRLGSAVDRISAVPTWQLLDGSRVSILLTVAGELAKPGKARLRCVDGLKTGDVRIRDMHISAVAAGKLTLLNSVSGDKTTGSGSPRIISSNLSPRIIPGDNAFHDAASVNLRAGRWWAIAKAHVLAGSRSDLYQCRLAMGLDYDDVRFGMSAQRWAGDLVPVGLQVVHTFGAPGAARLQCKGPAAFVVDEIMITAIKAGKLSNRWLDFGTTSTTGTGSPRIVSGWSDGPRNVPVSSKFVTVRKLTLPRGRWTVQAKLWFEGDSIPSDAVKRQTFCRLAYGGAKDASHIRYGNNLTRVAPMVLSLDHHARSAQSVKLQCRRSAPGGNGNLRFMKITAMKAGSLSQRPL